MPEQIDSQVAVTGSAAKPWYQSLTILSAVAGLTGAGLKWLGGLVGVDVPDEAGQALAPLILDWLGNLLLGGGGLGAVFGLRRAVSPVTAGKSGAEAINKGTVAGLLLLCILGLPGLAFAGDITGLNIAAPPSWLFWVTALLVYGFVAFQALRLVMGKPWRGKALPYLVAAFWLVGTGWAFAGDGSGILPGLSVSGAEVATLGLWAFLPKLAVAVASFLLLLFFIRWLGDRALIGKDLDTKEVLSAHALGMPIVYSSIIIGAAMMIGLIVG